MNQFQANLMTVKKPPPLLPSSELLWEILDVLPILKYSSPETCPTNQTNTIVAKHIGTRHAVENLPDLWEAWPFSELCPYHWNTT